MLIGLQTQLNQLANSLHIVTDAVGPIEPGQKVEVNILSSVSDLLVADKVLNIPLSAPVDIHVSWTVQDEHGTPLTLGKDFLAPNGLASPNIEFLFKPPILDLSTFQVATVLRTIKATVKLKSVATDDLSPVKESVPKDLELRLQLVPLEIPTILALFRHTDFRPFEDDMTAGFALLVVPDDSPLQGLTEPTNDLLRRIEGAVRPLRTLAGFAGFLTGLSVLHQVVAAQPMTRVWHGNISNLTDIHMNTETFLGFDIFNRDMRANDRVSSLILIGPPGRTAGCYSDEGFEEGEGAFKVHVGITMVALIRTLHIANLGGNTSIEVIVADTDGNKFGDSMSSVQFLEDTPIDNPIL